MNDNAGRLILILEDEPLIALDHEHHVHVAGFTQSAIISSCASALEWLQSNTPAVALLDVSLRDGPCSEIALILRDRNVPFVVCSGTVKENVDSAFLHGIWITKPCIPEDLVGALVQAKATVGRRG